jgi:hypothetical protein
MIPVEPRSLKNVASVTKIGFRSCSTHLVVDSTECFVEINDGYVRSIPANGALKYAVLNVRLVCVVRAKNEVCEYATPVARDRFYALAGAGMEAPFGRGAQAVGWLPRTFRPDFLC